MQTAERPRDHDHDHDHRRETTLAWARAALLIGLGLYFIYNIVSGSLANYINARFAWLSAVAAALFLLLGAAAVYRLLRHGHSHDHDHDHEHSAFSWGVIAVVAVPLALGALVPSQPLGASAVGGSFNMDAVASGSAMTFTIAPLDRNVLDWVRVFNATDDLSALNGQEADVIGFVYYDDTMDDDVFMVTRFTISCCVADSVAVGLPVQWRDVPPLDTWVRVLGRFELGTFRGEQKPILRPTSVEVVEQPAHPYLYP
ncbi:MAG: TIGR03943 family putative permease subunit [Aggregatilineales bacterium]